MRSRLIPLRLALAVAAVGCGDIAAPPPDAVQQPPVAAIVAPSPIPILRQARTAPRLKTYRISFWAKRGTQTTVQVDYRKVPGQQLSDPFLRFRIPINGLVAGAGGVPLARGDSVLITLSIDSVYFRVDFQPSGVVFSNSSPAQLAFWYQDSDPDLNGDGVVNATDATLEQNLVIWSKSGNGGWGKLVSRNDPNQQVVAAQVFHFSEYAVSW